MSVAGPTLPGEDLAGIAASFEEANGAVASDAEIEALVALLPDGLVLDAMAGVGRLLVPLLARGSHVHGAEGMPARFARLSLRLEAAGGAATLFRQDLGSLNVPFRYAGAFVAAPEAQALASARLAAGLARIRAHLVPPGTFVLGLVVPDIASHQPGAPTVEIERARLSEGSTITLRTEIEVDVEHRRIDRRERYERREGRDVVGRYDRHRRVTWYTEEEAIELVRAAGYSSVRAEPWSVAEPGLAGRAFAVIATG